MDTEPCRHDSQQTVDAGWARAWLCLQCEQATEWLPASPSDDVWTLEQIEAQAARDGVNRQQAEQLVGEVRRLRQAIEEIADDNSPHDAQLVACFVAETWRANATT